MKALGSIGAAAVPALMKELSSEVPGVDPNVAWALGEIGRPAVPSLVKALSSENHVLRQRAAEALERAGPAAKDAVPALKEALADRLAGHNAAWALAAIGDEGVRALLGALKSENPDVSWQAALGLGHAKQLPPGAAEEVFAFFRDAPALARGAAAEVLGNLRYEKAIPALVEALDEEYVDDEAKAALVKIGPGAIPELLKTLKSGRELQRIRAVWLLARSGWADPRIRPAIEALLKDEELKIRTAAEGALEELDEDE